MTGLLQDRVTRQADRHAGKRAIVMGDDSLTYGELEEAGNRLARVFQDAGCEPGDRLALFLTKSPWAIVSMLATLKAGCIYVPIDIASPAARVRRIMRSAEPRLVLASRAARDLLDDLVEGGDLDGVPVGSIDPTPVAGRHVHSVFTRSDWSGYAASPLGSQGSSDDIVHLLFTSGSTGAPKGVMITHANVASFITWATGYFGMTAGDRISGHPPLVFDLSTFDIYGTLSVGAELHLVPPETNLVPHKLAELIRSSQLTQWFSVPSTMTYMAKFDALGRGDFPALKRVLWCGEVLPTPTLLYWMERLPGVQFTNLYGPTEATIASSYYTVPEPPSSETEKIPIGTACAGEELLLLDQALRPAPVGEIADLYIAGAGLSPGYWRDQEKTRAAFLPDPRSDDPAARIYRTGDLARMTRDGMFHFVGRADSQIKSRGYRIELGEIEAALNSLAALRECAVIGVPTEDFDNTAICCAYATADGAGASHLRRELRRLVPSYMLPSRWKEFDHLPKNSNGKIDRAMLRGLFAQEVAG
jgi:amino acid adenylation domain-containing protein